MSSSSLKSFNDNVSRSFPRRLLKSNYHYWLNGFPSVKHESFLPLCRTRYPLCREAILFCSSDLSGMFLLLPYGFTPKVLHTFLEDYALVLLLRLADAECYSTSLLTQQIHLCIIFGWVVVLDLSLLLFWHWGGVQKGFIEEALSHVWLLFHVWSTAKSEKVKVHINKYKQYPWGFSHGSYVCTLQLVKPSPIWKTNDSSFPVLVYRMNLLYWKEILISWHLPLPQRFETQKTQILRASLKNNYLPHSLARAVHKRAVSVALVFFLVTLNVIQGKRRHLLNLAKLWYVMMYVPSVAVWHNDGELSLLLIFPIFHCFKKSFSILQRRAI